jgi:methionyl-tRNA formyltransferase
VRLIFYGTPPLAVPPLERLVSDGRAPVLVVTRADRPKGRGLKSGKSPVREAADRLGLDVVTPSRAGAPEEIERLRSLAPDLLIVVAYGQILPPAVLAIPRLGAINLHYSLLPRHRGASPIAAAILAGDRETGVTVMWMTEGLDEGPTFVSVATPIGEDEDAGSLGSRLAQLGAACLADALDRLERGESARKEQDPALATYAPKLSSDAGRLSFERAAGEIVRRVRAFTPEPGAFLPLREGRLIVTSAEAEVGFDHRAEPGTVLAIDPARGCSVAAADGSVWLRRVRPSGRRDMTGSAYANGARLRPGSRLVMSSAEA